MTFFYLTISFITLNSLFPIFLFFDLKYRRVPQKFFKFCYTLIIFSNIVEYSFSHVSILFFVYAKIIIGLFVFIISLLLFSLRIIGGGDGKLLILIFLAHPLQYLSFTIIFTFILIFCLLFVIYFLINIVINNKVKNRLSFFLFFNTFSDISCIKKSFIKGFYKFFNFSEICNYFGEKSVITSLYLVYNAEINKFQILSQNRPPLIILVIISYYIIFYFLLTN